MKTVNDWTSRVLKSFTKEIFIDINLRHERVNLHKLFGDTEKNSEVRREGDAKPISSTLTKARILPFSTRCSFKPKNGGRAQRLPLFNWLRNGWEGAWQYRELEGAHGILLGPFMGELGRFSSLTTKRQQALVTVWIKVVFWGCSELYTPETGWSVRFSLSAQTGGSAQSRRYIVDESSWIWRIVIWQWKGWTSRSAIILSS